MILEPEWVLRGQSFEVTPGEIAAVFAHLLTMPQVTVEDRGAVERALSNAGGGLDCVDARHHASASACERVVTFDDRRLAHRAKRVNLLPPVTLPG